MTVTELRNGLEQQKGQRLQIEKDIKLINKSQKGLKRELRSHEKAREIIKQVAIKTQEKLSYNISEITSMAMEAVLKNPYKLELEFVERRNKTECDIHFTRDEIKMDPFEGGIGAVDIAAFALRAASWSMQRPKNRNVLLLDEPFKHLKKESANRRMLEMIKQVSNKLGIQILMVSDERVSREATIKLTDKLFETSIKKGVTQIDEIK